MLVGDIYGGRDYTGIGLSGGWGAGEGGAPWWGEGRSLSWERGWGAAQAAPWWLPNRRGLRARHDPSPPLRTPPAANTIASSFGKVLYEDKVGRWACTPPSPCPALVS